MGSVKNLLIEKKPTPKSFGLGVFQFTDDYSVFDYGKMPDTIEGKGESLNRVAAFNFREMEKLGIKSHFIGVRSPNEMEVKLVQVINPQERKISPLDSNYLVPLEVIFRNSLPKGSSVLSRLEKGETTVEELGLEEAPAPGNVLKKPILEASTKLELTDRYLSWREAQEISALSDEEMDCLKRTALAVNDFLNSKAESIGFFHADGKVEVALSPEREVIVVDVFGTLDENRFLFNDFHVSKQVLRDYYKATPWFKQLSAAKNAGKPKGHWQHPPKLPQQLVSIVSEMYKSFAEAWLGERIWGVRPIPKIIKEFKEKRESFFGGV